LVWLQNSRWLRRWHSEHISATAFSRRCSPPAVLSETRIDAAFTLASTIPAPAVRAAPAAVKIFAVKNQLEAALRLKQFPHPRLAASPRFRCGICLMQNYCFAFIFLFSINLSPKTLDSFFIFVYNNRN
jgi:hypothetical protein